MKATVHPSSLSGMTAPPPSKSVFQRVVAGALLSPMETEILNPCFVDDGISALAMAGALGADIEEKNNALLIRGGLRPRQDFIDPGESGLGIRLFTPIAGLLDTPMEIRAHGSLTQRPMDVFRSPLEQLGVSFESNQGLPPLKVCGPMKPTTVQLDGSLSSQFVSGLLMALPTLNADSELRVAHPVSTPYITMTLEVMAAFGVEVVHKDFEKYTIFGQQPYQADSIEVSGDWSGGAMLLVAAAIAGGGQVWISNLSKSFTQADEAIVGAMLFAGCKMAKEQDGIRVTAHKIKGFEFDATQCPDLFPPLAALACYADKPSIIKGVQRLKNKESDRGIAIRDEFEKAGIRVDLEDDLMVVHPGVVQACEIDCHNDHRIAMAGALLALGAAGPITLHGIECLGKSYPDFMEDLMDLGAHITP